MYTVFLTFKFQCYGTVAQCFLYIQIWVPLSVQKYTCSSHLNFSVIVHMYLFLKFIFQCHFYLQNRTYNCIMNKIWTIKEHSMLNKTLQNTNNMKRKRQQYVEQWTTRHKQNEPEENNMLNKKCVHHKIRPSI